MCRKIFRQTLATLLIVTSLLMAAIVGAAIQTFDGLGEWHTSDAETPSIAMAHAKQRAEMDAKKKAGVAIKSISRSINSELAEDAVSAVTNKIIEIVGDVNYNKKSIQLSENQTTILYTATLKAKIDTDGIYAWIKSDNKEKVTSIQQNNDLQNAIAKNDKLSESLNEKYNRATSQAEKDNIRKQTADAEREFLSNQKVEEAEKIRPISSVNYRQKITLYNKALKLNPNNILAYEGLRDCFSLLEQYDDAFLYANKIIELEPNNAVAYMERGDLYQRYEYHVEEQLYEKLAEKIKNHNLNEEDISICFELLNKSISDYTKALELGLTNYYHWSSVYSMRIQAYKAIIDLYDVLSNSEKFQSKKEELMKKRESDRKKYREISKKIDKEQERNGMNWDGKSSTLLH